MAVDGDVWAATGLLLQGHLEKAEPHATREGASRPWGVGGMLHGHPGLPLMAGVTDSSEKRNVTREFIHLSIYPFLVHSFIQAQAT